MLLLLLLNRNSNTSHVNLYRKCVIGFQIHNLHSNTSHVNLYPPVVPIDGRPFPIQIHLMLIFITPASSVPNTVSNSNTSHVNLYPVLQCPLIARNIYSNTSHVNLYRQPPSFPFPVQPHSNTSHVNLYPAYFRLTPPPLYSNPL